MQLRKALSEIQLDKHQLVALYLFLGHFHFTNFHRTNFL